MSNGNTGFDPMPEIDEILPYTQNRPRSPLAPPPEKNATDHVEVLLETSETSTNTTSPSSNLHDYILSEKLPNTDSTIDMSSRLRFKEKVLDDASIQLQSFVKQTRNKRKILSEKDINSIEKMVEALSLYKSHTTSKNNVDDKNDEMDNKLRSPWAKAAYILGILAYSSSKACDAVVAAGSISRLIEMLQPGSKNVSNYALKCAAGAIGQITHKNRFNADFAFREGAIPGLVPLIASSDARVKKWSAYALTQISHESADRCIALAHSGVIPLLIDALNDTGSHFQEPFVDVIGNLATHSSKYPNKLTNVIEPLIRLLTSNARLVNVHNNFGSIYNDKQIEFDSGSIQNEKQMEITTLADNSSKKGSRSKVLKRSSSSSSSGDDVNTQKSQKYSESLTESIIYALSHLAHKSRRYTRIIIEVGGIQSLVFMMYLDSSRIHSPAIEMLQIMGKIDREVFLLCLYLGTVPRLWYIELLSQKTFIKSSGLSYKQAWNTMIGGYNTSDSFDLLNQLRDYAFVAQNILDSGGVSDMKQQQLTFALIYLWLPTPLEKDTKLGGSDDSSSAVETISDEMKYSWNRLRDLVSSPPNGNLSSTLKDPLLTQLLEESYVLSLFEHMLNAGRRLDHVVIKNQSNTIKSSVAENNHTYRFIPKHIYKNDYTCNNFHSKAQSAMESVSAAADALGAIIRTGHHFLTNDGFRDSDYTCGTFKNSERVGEFSVDTISIKLITLVQACIERRDKTRMKRRGRSQKRKRKPLPLPLPLPLPIGNNAEKIPKLDDMSITTLNNIIEQAIVFASSCDNFAAVSRSRLPFEPLLTNIWSRIVQQVKKEVVEIVTEASKTTNK